MLTNEVFGPKEKLIGYIETDSGSVLMTDGIWNNEIPNVQQKRVVMDLESNNSKIPVYSVIRNEHRYLIVDIDNAVRVAHSIETVDVEGVEEEDKEKDKEAQDKEEELTVTVPELPK